VRIVMAYCANPAPGTDLTNPDETRALVRTFVLPGILALRVESERSMSEKVESSGITNDPHRPTSSITQPTKGAAQ
jgi:hypothetical protein